MKKIALIIVLLCHTIAVIGQEIKKEHSSFWNTILTDVNLNDDWYLLSEFHFRRTNFLNDWEQIILRPSFHYKPNTTYDFSFGYSYIKNYTFSDFSSPINANEHNIWQQIGLSHSHKKLKFNHRFRLEERFIDKIISSSEELFTVDGTNYNNRFRYRITLNRPLFKMKEASISLVVFDEIWLNLDKGIRPKSFNQNWFYTGVDYPLNKHFTLGMGYQNIALQGNEDIFITNHLLQTTVSYSIN